MNENNIKELGFNKMKKLFSFPNKMNENNIKELGFNKINTVKNLKQLARQRELRGYSRLRKAELINLLEQPVVPRSQPVARPVPRTQAEKNVY